MIKETGQAPGSKLPTSKIWWWIATWFGSGLAPKASGTFGTIAALPFAFIIQYYFRDYGLLIATIIIFSVGWWASNEYMKYYPQKHDPKQIVVDEVAGIWLLLSVLPFSWQGYFAGFVLFRFFDVLKPYPISLADRKIKGGFGVMFDDILAAIYSLLIIAAFLILDIICPSCINSIFSDVIHCDKNGDWCEQ